jgi:hypothetical protein
MQVFWEKIGILGPVYRLTRHGLRGSENANHFDITQVRVHDRIDWMQHFLHCENRDELAQETSHAKRI